MNSDSPNTNLPTKVNCPTCKKSVVWNEQSHYRPFCSQRCQQIDFGEWASESFSIPGAPNNQGQEHQEQGNQGYAESEFDNLEQGPTRH
jgi:endogenous inhibitor of DNA gyrase (YacG/DUF329 family)